MAGGTRIALLQGHPSVPQRLFLLKKKKKKTSTFQAGKEIRYIVSTSGSNGEKDD